MMRRRDDAAGGHRIYRGACRLSILFRCEAQLSREQAITSAALSLVYDCRVSNNG